MQKWKALKVWCRAGEGLQRLPGMKKVSTAKNSRPAGMCPDPGPMPAGPKGLQLPAGRLAAKRQAAGRPQVPQALAPVRKGVPVLPVLLLLKEAPEETLLAGDLLPVDPIKTARQRAETAPDLDSSDSGNY